MIQISSLNKLGSDSRGYTYEYFHERYGLHIIAFRKAGSISGRHFHKGNALNKNPEIIILCSGSMELNYKHFDDIEIKNITITEPCKIQIPPYCWHEIIAITDCTFIELNSIEEHASDTYQLK